VVLTEKKATIGPHAARIVTITPSDATSNRTTVPSVKRDPTSALNT